MQWTSKRCCRPRDRFFGKPFMEDEWKDRKQGIKPEIPNQRQRCVSRIEMFEMPCVLQSQHGDERDRRGQKERKELPHAPKQKKQEQTPTQKKPQELPAEQ